MLWNEDGSLFYFGSGDGTIEVLRYPEFSTVRSTKAHSGSIYCLDIHDNLLACGATDALISVWSLDELVCLRTYAAYEAVLRTISFSHCGTYLAAGGEEPQIEIVKQTKPFFFLSSF